MESVDLSQNKDILKILWCCYGLLRHLILCSPSFSPHLSTSEQELLPSHVIKILSTAVSSQ